MLCNLCIKFKEWIRAMSFYLILEAVIFIVVFLSNIVGLEIIFFSIINEIMLNQLWSYYINLKEKFIIHNYKRNNKNFNKEYYDMYWNYNLVIFKVLLVLEYLVLILYTSIFHNSKLKVELTLEYPFYIFGGFIALVIGVFIWALFMIWFQSWKYNRKTIELTAKKKENYTAYTEYEIKILDQD